MRPTHAPLADLVLLCSLACLLAFCLAHFWFLCELTRPGAQFIKESMDKKFGSPWHCVAGKGFSFEVSHETKNILYVFVAGETGVLIWKC